MTQSTLTGLTYSDGVSYQSKPNHWQPQQAPAAALQTVTPPRLRATTKTVKTAKTARVVEMVEMVELGETGVTLTRLIGVLAEFRPP